MDLPVNLLLLPGGPTVAALAALGVRRISVGGSLAYAVWDGLVVAARELCEQGTTGFLERSARGRESARSAFAR